MGKVLVIGETVSDHYWRGNCYRKNPESDAPLLKIESKEFQPGGAANVAVNCQSLGSKVTLCSWVGRDEDGQKLLMHLNGLGIDTSLTTVVGKTTQKIRIFNGDECVTRADFDYDPDLDPEEQLFDSLRLAAEIEKRINEFDVVVVSDYNRGWLSEPLCQQIISICNENEVFVLCDPKGQNLDKYHGASLLSPNYEECVKLTDSEDLEEAATLILKNISNVLATLSEHGMRLYNEKGKRHWKALAKTVNSVAGCGDALCGGIAHFLAEKETLEDAIEKTNILLGEALEQTGTIILRK